MKVVIIGGNGGMGRLLGAAFTAAGCSVTAASRRAGPPPEELARTSDAVVISVPIEATLPMIARIGPVMPEGALLCDVTSFKTEPVRAMLTAAHCEVVGMHPLCGPQVGTLAGQNVVLCPGRGQKKLVWLRGVLEAAGARVTEATPEQHDERMAIVQGMNHLHTLLLGVMFAELGVTPRDLDGFTTVALRAKLELLQRLKGSPDLYARLIGEHARVPGLLAACRPALDAALAAAAAGDVEALRGLIERS